MKAKYRKAIHKIPILYKLCERIVDINNFVFYLRMNKKNREKLQKLKNSHQGEKCFIVGNGPSLNMKDLELIKDYDCFASNLIFKIFDRTDWRPKYYFIQDRYADTGNILDNIDLEMLFVGDYYWRKRGMKNPNAICIHCRRAFSEEIPFSTDISKYIIDHCTITYTMIQAAIYMGYKQIYLLGMDHSYTLTYDKNGNVVEDASVVSHVFEDENPQDIIANVEGMNKSYISARNYADQHNISIINVTRGGRLEWFERNSLDNVV